MTRSSPTDPASSLSDVASGRGPSKVEAGDIDAGLRSNHFTTDFIVCDVFSAAPKDDLGSMEHPIFSLATRPDRRMMSYEHNNTRIDIVPSVKGRATIHDKDVLIYCVSQLMAALNAGLPVSRTLHLTAHDLLVATNRETSGDAYRRLKEAFERLAGTRITTNLVTGGLETSRGFGLFVAWENVRRTKTGGGGRMVSVSVTLSEWLFRAVLSRSVLTLSRDYFRLRKPLERRLYELARKHCGRQASWPVSVAVLHKKSGSAAPLRVFRASLRRIAESDTLPDYALREEPGDRMVVERRRPVVAASGSRPWIDEETRDRARALVPGADVHALEARWLNWWAETGRIRLNDSGAAFLGWIRRQPEAGPPR